MLLCMLALQLAGRCRESTYGKAWALAMDGAASFFARSKIEGGMEAGSGTCLVLAFVTDASGRIAGRDFRLIQIFVRVNEAE